jgi:hypothetical protein
VGLIPILFFGWVVFFPDLCLFSSTVSCLCCHYKFFCQSFSEWQSKLPRSDFYSLVLLAFPFLSRHQSALQFGPIWSWSLLFCLRMWYESGVQFKQEVAAWVPARTVLMTVPADFFRPQLLMPVSARSVASSGSCFGF